jgi:hypothetical protein
VVFSNQQQWTGTISYHRDSFFHPPFATIYVLAMKKRGKVLAKRPGIYRWFARRSNQHTSTQLLFFL